MRVEDAWTTRDAGVAAAEDGRHVSRRCWIAMRVSSRAESLVSVAWACTSTPWAHCSNGSAVGFAVVVCSARCLRGMKLQGQGMMILGAGGPVPVSTEAFVL